MYLILNVRNVKGAHCDNIPIPITCVCFLCSLKRSKFTDAIRPNEQQIAKVYSRATVVITFRSNHVNVLFF